ncbi:MAG: phosphatase [Planctomycetaceae bacterium]|nr:phosphatase [Planctomycetaceae bacterium]
MPQISAFRGLRYDLGHVGALSDVIAPPYDVIGKDLQDDLYKQHPANVIRLILNRDEPGDADANNRYTRAARFLKNWQEEGVLQNDRESALYVYHQIFEYGGSEFTRRGFMARMGLQRFGEGNIYPHEETHSAAKEDRLKLTRACAANLSQIFGIYPDSTNEAQSILEATIAGVAPLEATDHLGVVHRLWPVSDSSVINQVATIMADKPMFVADGHHRYETACNYRDELAGGAELDPTHPANAVMTMCVSMDDPGMIVLPTHRLFKGLPALTADQLRDRLSGLFDIEDLTGGPAAAHEIWAKIEAEDDQGRLGLRTQADGKWLVAVLTETGRAKMAEVASEHSKDWQGLGVSILQRLIVETMLEARDLPKPTYVHTIEEVVDALETTPENYPLAALVMPATLDHIRAISEHGERMPAKSTYFYPKLLSGLVINPLR